jgi:hypothetical protein
VYTGISSPATQGEDEVMKMRITKCTSENRRYEKYIGDVIEVRNHPNFDHKYIPVEKMFGPILKCDCEPVSTTSSEKSSPFTEAHQAAKDYVQQAKNISSEPVEKYTREKLPKGAWAVDTGVQHAFEGRNIVVSIMESLFVNEGNSPLRRYAYLNDFGTISSTQTVEMIPGFTILEMAEFIDLVTLHPPQEEHIGPTGREEVSEMDEAEAFYRKEFNIRPDLKLIPQQEEHVERYRRFSAHQNAKLIEENNNLRSHIQNIQK